MDSLYYEFSLGGIMNKSTIKMKNIYTHNIVQSQNNAKVYENIKTVIWETFRWSKYITQSVFIKSDDM